MVVHLCTGRVVELHRSHDTEGLRQSVTRLLITEQLCKVSIPDPRGIELHSVWTNDDFSRCKIASITFSLGFYSSKALLKSCDLVHRILRGHEFLGYKPPQLESMMRVDSCKLPISIRNTQARYGTALQTQGFGHSDSRKSFKLKMTASKPSRDLADHVLKPTIPDSNRAKNPNSPRSRSRGEAFEDRSPKPQPVELAKRLGKRCQNQFSEADLAADIPQSLEVPQPELPSAALRKTEPRTSSGVCLRNPPSARVRWCRSGQGPDSKRTVVVPAVELERSGSDSNGASKCVAILGERMPCTERACPCKKSSENTNSDYHPPSPGTGKRAAAESCDEVFARAVFTVSSFRLQREKSRDAVRVRRLGQWGVNDVV